MNYAAAIVATGAAASLVTPATALAQQARINVPAMPLDQALDRIATLTGARITYDPEQTEGLRSKAVINAASAADAIAAAVAGRDLTVDDLGGNRFEIAKAITVTAKRDEAETGLLVRQTSTSSRTGQALREQPRNAQIISAKLLQDQQARTLNESLASAVGVVVNGTNVQSGASYTMRGYASSPLVNGLVAGSQTAVANIERIEVLKGPDAVLAGADNQGGFINVVLKKPSADPFRSVRLETGSFGEIRGTLDFNTAITHDHHLSARLIAVGSGEDHNPGGYRGDRDRVLTPSLRFKNDSSDFILTGGITDSRTGLASYVPFNVLTGRPYERPIGKPLFDRDQYLRQKNKFVLVDVTQRIADWVTFVARGQVSNGKLSLHNYTPMAVIDASRGIIAAFNGESGQEFDNLGADTFLRFRFKALGIEHTLATGYNYGKSDVKGFGAQNEEQVLYDLTKEPGGLTPIAPADFTAFQYGSINQGVFAQDTLTYGKAHLNAGIRRTHYDSIYRDSQSGATLETRRANAVTYNFGLVYDLFTNISLWGTYVSGFHPTFLIDYRTRQQLHHQENWSKEGGVKIDLFGKRALLTVSYFDSRQSIRILTDTEHHEPGMGYLFGLERPGQVAHGIDASIAGRITRGWDLQAGYTGITYKQLLVPGESQAGLFGQPARKFSVYTAYRRPVGQRTEAGLGLGVYGQDGVKLFRQRSAPSSLEVNTNAFLTRGPLDLNVGVRNLFNRRNFEATTIDTYLPLKVPRTWRLSLGYRF
ncbi:MAG: TonB-dependent receptor [Sphingomonas phyllosphaerae]|uniref:TonB-dependent siderophore receptor n=1 Tax=Sphingomonas phyllosphaerae TaxID=257003 RepID=UPI002FFA1BEB